MADDRIASEDCPPDMAFVELLEGRLPEPDAEQLRRHAARCSRCHETLGGLDEHAPVGLDATVEAEPGIAGRTTVAATAGTSAAVARGLLGGGHAEGDAPSSVGRTLDRRYRVLRLLGKGAMGEVYEAEHTATGRHVAVKLINARLLALSEDARRRFKREGKAGGGVDSPHIVEVLDAGEDEATGDLFLVMEQLRGEDLQRLLDRVGPLAPDAALRIAAQALAGLARAHAAGVVHRDVKPANLFLARRDDGEITVKVLDFGIAKITARSQELAETAGLTGTEGILGTPLYMSPEAVQSSKDVDARSDVWSLGSVLYCALAGQAPFSQVASVGKLLVAICTTTPPPLRARAPWVAPEVAEVVQRALERAPDERTPSAEAMLDALRALLPDGFALRDTMLTGVSPDLRAAVPSRPPPPPPPPRDRPRSRWLIGAGAALVAIGGAIAAQHAMQTRPDPPPPTGSPRRITHGASWSAEPALSPDGKQVAYVSDEKGSPDIWVVDARGGEPRRLDDDPAEDRTPAWFPDGSAVAFTSDRGGRESIWKVPSAGGPATWLLPGIDPAISPDGTRIAFVRADAHGRYLVGVAPLADPGRAEVLTTDADGLWENRHPRWSPDGRTLAYQDHQNVWLVPAAGGRARRLTSGSSGDTWPSFSPDGRHLYFSSHREDTLALWRASTGDGALARLTLGTGSEVEPYVARDGAELAYSTYAEERSLILVDVAAGTQARMPYRGIFALAPDGREILYVPDRQDHHDLWAQPLERRAPRGEPRRLVELPGSLASVAVSPDGRWIAVYRVLEGRRDLWVLPAGGGVPERITSDDAMHVEPVWSHDGASLAFLSDRSGKDQVWTVPVASGHAAGEARQVTFDDTTKDTPAWSPHDDEIAFAAGTGGGSEIAIVRLSGGAPRRVTSGAGVSCVRWDRATGEIYASGTWGGPRKSLRRVSPSTGEAKPLDPDPGFGNVATGLFDVSLDGTTIALRREDARGDVWLLDAPKGASY